MWVGVHACLIIVYNIPRQASIERAGRLEKALPTLVCLLSTHLLKYALSVTASGTVQTIIYLLIVSCSEVLKYSCAAICHSSPPPSRNPRPSCFAPWFPRKIKKRAASFPPRYHPTDRADLPRGRAREKRGLGQALPLQPSGPFSPD